MRANLPKLYRPVYVGIEYCHDTCVGGEHHQEEGINYIKVKRVIGADLCIKWIVAESLWMYCDYDKKNIHRHVSEIDDQCVQREDWASKPSYEGGYSDDELMEIKIQNAIKYHHAVSYKQRMKDEMEMVEFERSFNGH